MKKILKIILISANLVIPVFAQSAPSASQRAGLGSMLILFLPLIIIWYFLLIRPQQKKEKERQLMIQNLQKGDKVVTIGGIYGEIAQVKEDRIVLKIADKVNIEISKSAISGKVK